MATHSYIWLKIKPKDFGRVITCSVNKLPNKLVENNYPCGSVHIHPNPHNGILYMGIYCHFDGYRDGVGKELAEKFTTYEDVLNLISLGHCSYIMDEICSYHNWRGGKLAVMLEQGERPRFSAEYNYIFEDDCWLHTNNFIDEIE